MIEACALVGHYGATAVVNDLNFTIRAGLVTGFLGPNGVDNTATMRLIFGLDYPSAGSVLGGRTARNQLLGLAQTNGIGGRRVDELLEMVGLAEVARTRSPDCAPPPAGPSYLFSRHCR